MIMSTVMKFNMLDYLDLLLLGDDFSGTDIFSATYLLENDINDYILQEVCYILEDKFGIKADAHKISGHPMITHDFDYCSNKTTYFFENGIPGGIELVTFTQRLDGNTICIEH